MTNKFLITVFFILVFPICVLAAEKTVSIPKIGDLKLDVPAGWKHSITTDRTVTVSFFPRPKSHDEVTLSFIPDDPAIKNFTGTAAIKKMLEEGIRYNLNNIEDKFVLNKLSDKGYYYSVAFIRPMSGEPKYLTKGGVVCDKYLLIFSLSSDSFDEKVVAQTLKMVSSAVLAAKKDTHGSSPKE